MSSSGADTVELLGSTVSLDATLIAKDLGLEADQVLEALREGRLTALCEQGMAQDAGRIRLTFYHRHWRLRLVVDAAGRVLERFTSRLHQTRRSQQKKGG